MKIDYKHLSVQERILLVEDIWDSIAEENAAPELNQEQKALLEDRLETYNKTTKRTTWDAIKKKAKSKKRK